MHICMDVYNTYVCMCVCKCKDMCTYVLCIYTYVYVCECKDMCMYIYICMYVCVFYLFHASRRP